MTTKQAFLAQADIELLNPQYGKIAELKQAQDPFVVAQIGAMAQMLELYSTQQNIAETEVFLKARDATICGRPSSTQARQPKSYSGFRKGRLRLR
jgi:hypothetical protein